MLLVKILNEVRGECTGKGDKEVEGINSHIYFYLFREVSECLFT